MTWNLLSFRVISAPLNDRMKTESMTENRWLHFDFAQ